MEKVRKGVGGCLKRLRADALKVDEAKGTTGRVSVAVDEQMSVGRSGRTGREEEGRGGRLENIRSGTSMHCEYKYSSIGPLRLAHWSHAFPESCGLAEETQRLRVVLSFDQGGVGGGVIVSSAVFSSGWNGLALR